MAHIKINDIFDELIEENIEITECLNVLIKFKTFVDSISSKLKSNLGSNDLKMFYDLHKEVEEVFKSNKRDFSVHKNLIQKKTQTNLSNRLQLSFKYHKQSKLFEFKSQLMSKTSDVGKQTQRKIIEGKDFSFDENQRFVCSFIGCGKSFKSRDSIRHHLVIHSIDLKVYECDFDGCPFKTRKRCELRDHINAHKGIKPFVCDFCGKQFSAQRYLKSHVGFIHKVADQILVCDLEECHKEFKTERSLRHHQLFHVKERRLVCDAPNCGYKTIQSSLLQQHISRVHSKERPFPCQVEGCPKRYKNTSELRDHMQTHSSERNFNCEFEGCHKAFKTAKNLKKHTVLHSDIQLGCDWPGCEFTTKRSFNLRKHQIIHCTERKFLCNWPECGKRFKNKTQLETHIRIHKSDKRYACSWPGCQYRCTDSGNLIKHRRIHLKN